MKYLSAPDVILIHDSVINAHELQGEAPDKSVESVIARVLNRLEYGLIGDVFELAACYAAFIAVAHAFNDANKRTAFAALDTLLALNGVELDYGSPEDAGGMIVKVVLGEVDELGLADWLRSLSCKL
ncbi:type II toxin-antitoxin system death-on-curing family toxin [Thiothrix litoralis]|jgi:death-on-curing protein|uniref:Type II toxin-antitoxin system death-on-curing family toxin n=1 Tax=Thiothrix litoralis TaxID=2891210 RepID=A0ABX7X0Z6_9GAMM|nr:type II toxin-antitoxin system death-on-curing family toxin [Thiothrix litoralis]QTR47504.1 type II toxin-antitoxin system death-on-curing family toxin [Thiothrix litoralis]